MSKISHSDDRRGQRCRRVALNFGVRARCTTRRACPGWVLSTHGGDVFVEGLSLTELEVVLDRCGDDLELAAAARWILSGVLDFEERGLVGPELFSVACRVHRETLEIMRGQVQQVVTDVRSESSFGLVRPDRVLNMSAEELEALLGL